ncbi:MAG: DUF2817 domain-containing protein [Anaerolineales bacterium]|nr:DUF2817 domain-containing protein [Anaerolineales bacterium]
MSTVLELFPETYEASRQRFRDNLGRIQARWPGASLSQKTHHEAEDLTTDWISARPLGQPEKIFILTTAEHGIEGYVGSAMLQRFIEHFLPALDPHTTGLLLVHAINPWGMKYHRRVNANNVDLNRSFLYGSEFDPAFNPEYEEVEALLNPKTRIPFLPFSRLASWLNLAVQASRLGLRKYTLASLLGQYRHPRGLYYGGPGYQPETETMMALYRQAFQDYGQILHLDMHTGYGPRYQMSLVNSALEMRSSQEFAEQFDYPLVVAATPDEFYAIQGDMIDHVYALAQNEFPEKRFFATAFEFGTFGLTAGGLLRSRRAMIYENRLHWYGSVRQVDRETIQAEFEELFNPQALDWKEKAIADADQAFAGILKAEGYLA